jgi:hypothetical protein
MNFNIPKIKCKYRVLDDIEVKMYNFDADTRRRLAKLGINDYGTRPVMLNAGSIIRFERWYSMDNHLQLRIFQLINPSYNKACGYLEESNEFLRAVNIEEIPV